MSTSGKPNLTKIEICSKISGSTQLQLMDVTVMVQQTLDTIIDALAEGRNVELRNFGVFEVKYRKARIGRNPNNPTQTVQIAARAQVKLKPGKIMTERVEKLVAQPEPVIQATQMEAPVPPTTPAA